MSRNALIALAVVLVVLGALAFFGQRGQSPTPTAGAPFVPGNRSVTAKQTVTDVRSRT